MSKNYYEILEVEKTASLDEIKNSYRKKALQYHPDRNQGEDNIKNFKEVSEAFEILSDPEKRQQYDRFGSTGQSAFNFGGGGNPFDMFSSIFGFNEQSLSNHIEIRLEITLEDAINGCEKTISLDRREACTPCKGTGAKDGTAFSTCSVCRGQGRATHQQGPFIVMNTCHVCRGKGQAIKDKCSSCNGNGFNHGHTEINLKIPAGVDNGYRVIARGMGHIGQGDLVSHIVLQKHPLFEKHDADLYIEMPLTISQFVLGDKIKLDIINNKTVEVKIPAGTQNGSIFRIKDHGFPVGKTFGDLLIKVIVDIPDQPSKEYQNIINKLKKLENQNQGAKLKKFTENVNRIC